MGEHEVGFELQIQSATKDPLLEGLGELGDEHNLTLTHHGIKDIPDSSDKPMPTSQLNLPGIEERRVLTQGSKIGKGREALVFKSLLKYLSQICDAVESGSTVTSTRSDNWMKYGGCNGCRQSQGTIDAN